MRRDIYKGDTINDFSFILNYDKDDLLAEVEVHRCSKIQIADFAFNFEEEVCGSKYESIFRGYDIMRRGDSLQRFAYGFKLSEKNGWRGR